ncbi:hypothetical protein NXX22_26630 [Bacteroides thetaiotaomicron]|nr:hypothetical protein [Bacteroides thetaiotaomicron]
MNMRTVAVFRIGVPGTAEGTTATPPYDKLEPRFKATILYNGATWKEQNDRILCQWY